MLSRSIAHNVLVFSILLGMSAFSIPASAGVEKDPTVLCPYMVWSDGSKVLLIGPECKPRTLSFGGSARVQLVNEAGDYAFVYLQNTEVHFDYLYTLLAKGFTDGKLRRIALRVGTTNLHFVELNAP